MGRLTAPILVMEAIVLLLAVPVGVVVEGADPRVAGTGAGVLILAAVVVAGMLRRHRWAYVAGTVVQVFVIASGVVVTTMFVLGAIFAGLWGTAIWLEGRASLPGSR